MTLRPFAAAAPYIVLYTALQCIRGFHVVIDPEPTPPFKWPTAIAEAGRPGNYALLTQTDRSVALWWFALHFVLQLTAMWNALHFVLGRSVDGLI